MNALDAYQLGTRRTWRRGPDDCVNAALGLAGETGEVIEWIKKSIFHGKHLPRDDLKLELGDVLYYLARVADIYGFSLSEVAEANDAKLQARYPDGFKP